MDLLITLEPVWIARSPLPRHGTAATQLDKSNKLPHHLYYRPYLQDCGLSNQYPEHQFQCLTEAQGLHIGFLSNGGPVLRCIESLSASHRHNGRCPKEFPSPRHWDSASCQPGLGRENGRRIVRGVGWDCGSLLLDKRQLRSPTGFSGQRHGLGLL